MVFERVSSRDKHIFDHHLNRAHLNHAEDMYVT